MYKLDTTGHLTVLYSFTGTADGGSPTGVIRDAAGNLYGTAVNGGAISYGVIYKLDTTGHQTVLHNFTGLTDGASPNGGLIRDSAGNVYGTTYSGGAHNAGNLYKFDRAGNLTVVFSFTGVTDGAGPNGGLIRDSASTFTGPLMEEVETTGALCTRSTPQVMKPYSTASPQGLTEVALWLV